jgi:hypothetical protein
VIVADRASAVGGLRHIVVATASGRRGLRADMSGVVPSEGLFKVTWNLFQLISGVEDEQPGHHEQGHHE